MTHTSEDIKKLDDPYAELNSSDQLVEHQEELDKLSSKEMKKLASKMMFACPHSKLNDFGHAIKAIKGSTFHPVLYQAYEVTQRIHALLNPDHPSPHDLLTGKEFNGDLFNEFTKLSLKFIKDNETTIATRLALTTPKEQRNEVSKNVRNTFRDSELPAKIGAAFTLRRSIDLLLGDKPKDFFTCEEFNIDLCNEFSMMFPPLLKGKEQAIGEKLSTLEPLARHQIALHFEKITCQAYDKENPFKLICAAMVPKVEEAKTVVVVPEEVKSEAITNSSNNRYSFSSELRSRKEKVAALTTTAEDSESDDDVDDSSCISSLCGLLGK